MIGGSFSISSPQMECYEYRQNFNSYSHRCTLKTTNLYEYLIGIGKTPSKIKILKLTLKKFGIILGFLQSTIVEKTIGDSRLIIPLTTTKACQTKLYWTGPSSTFKVYGPGTTDISTSSPVYNLGSGQSGAQFSININAIGTWYI